MLDDRILTFSPDVQRHLVAYVRQWFAPEDDVLTAVRQNTRDQGLPEIQIRPEEGQMLQFLARLVGARQILEIGTLAGYSGIWLARGLPPGGRLLTLEADPKHATIAQQHFKLAGVADRVKVKRGNAHDTLKTLRGPYDMVFIDAEKEGYPAYLEWCLSNVRPGGLIAAHNAFRGGRLVAPDNDAGMIGLRSFLQTLSTDKRLVSTIIPVGDGFAVALLK